MMSFTVNARRIDEHLSAADNGRTSLSLGTDMAGNDDALNPMELLLAALSACMLKGINRLTPILGVTIDRAAVELTAERRDTPPGVDSINYTIRIDSPDDDDKLDLLHDNLKKFGTVTNTIAQGTNVSGQLLRF